MGAKVLKEQYFRELNNGKAESTSIKPKNADKIQNTLFVKYRIRENQQEIRDDLIESGSISITNENYREIQKLLYYLEVESKYKDKKYIKAQSFRDISIVENILRGYLKSEGIVPNLKKLLKNFWEYGLKGRSRERGREIIIMDLTK